MILLSAGNGDLSKGFENVLDLYHHLHNEGFRPGMELNSLQIGRETNEQPQWDQSIVGKVRESIRNV